MNEGTVLLNDAFNILFMVIWCQKEWRKEMFYLTMHSTHFIYGYKVSEGMKEGGREEGNVLFNDAFNTFYLWL